MSLYFAARGWILAALYVALLWSRALSDAPLRPLWLLLVVPGVALRLWAGAHLGIHGNAPRAEAARLSRGGPYRFSRNPLYLSNILIAAGILFFANALSFQIEVLVVIAVILHHAILIRTEENALRKILGATYGNYLREVPRWLGVPGKTGRLEEGGGGVPLQTLLRRQGRNILYALACVLAIWLAAR
jgi:protein-S-isoprenylcysteine O-methyltransferase Ste14